MQLIEREAQLRELNALLKKAITKSGQIALVSGEAWSGKSALIKKFLSSHSRKITILTARCHPSLLTNSPAISFEPGQLQEAAAVKGLMHNHDWRTLGDSLLARMEGEPTVLVIEDAHQADEISLDLIGYLARSIERTRALLILAYRDDELPAWHPLNMLVGELVSSQRLTQIPTPGLSLEVVKQQAAAAGLDAQRLHSQTGGNPFLLTEMLQAGEGETPIMVRKAFLARAGHLSPSGRNVLEAAAVLDSPVEPWLLLEMTAADWGQIDAVIYSGLLQPDGDQLRFRRPLARQVILEAISPARRIELHRRAYAVMSASALTKENDARLAHHAAAGADETAVLLHAPVAARKAKEAGSLHEAAQHYACALVFAASLGLEEKVKLLEEYADCCLSLGENDAAAQAYAQAGGHYQNARQWVDFGRVLSLKAESMVRAWMVDEALETNLAAIHVLQAQSPSAQLA